MTTLLSGEWREAATVDSRGASGDTLRIERAGSRLVLRRYGGSPPGAGMTPRASDEDAQAAN